MAEEAPRAEGQERPYADVPPRLIYEAAFTARNSEIDMLDSNSRYFYLGQTALFGYMLFEFKSYLHDPTSMYFLLVVETLCFFALSFHAVYSERRISGSFRLMAVCEDTCEYYERHGFIDPALFFYGKPEVRDRNEGREFAEVQEDFVTVAANVWFYCAFTLVFAIGCLAVYQLLARYYHVAR